MNANQLGANTSCLADLPLQESVDQMRNLGFRGIALLAFANTRHGYGDLAGFWFHDLSDSEREWLRSQVADFERVALHAPFAELPLFTYDPRLRRLSLDRVEEAIEAAEYLGAQVVTVHANRRSNLHLSDYWDDMVHTFRSLGQYALDRGVRIGVETGFPDSIDQFVDLLEAVGHYGVGATLDCGHINRYVDADLWRTPAGARQLNQQLMDMTRQLGPLIIHCHVHDVRLSDWRDHQAIGRGVIDFEPFLTELQSLGYEGMLELELEEQDQMVALKESKSRLESMLLKLNRRFPGQRRAA